MLVLLCASAKISKAQTTTFGSTSPSLTNVTATGPTESKFTLDSNRTCPVPSFTIGSFFGRATNNANPIILPPTGLNETANSNLNNFGVTAGLTIPIGGSLSKSCKKLFEAQARAFDIENQIGTAKFQSELVQECYYLYSLHINFDQPAFNQDGPVAGLFPCRAIVKAIDPPPTPVGSTPPKVEKNVEEALSKDRNSKITSPELPSTQNTQPLIIIDDR